MSRQGNGNRVLMLHGSSDVYGASKIFLITATVLQQNGNQVMVVLSEPGPLSRQLQDLGIRVAFIRLGVIRRKYFNIRGLINRIRVMFRAYKALSALAEQEGTTHVYSNTAAVWVGTVLAKRKKYRHVWHLHEIISRPVWFAALMGKMVGYGADRVIVVSKAVKTHWERYLSGNKLHLVYNGIDYNAYLYPAKDLREELGIPQEATVIGMVGRVNSWKGQQYFLDISEELNKKFLDLHFVLVGDAFPGEECLFDGLEQKILEKKYKDKIHNLGFRENISQVLATMDIFILPSTLPDPFPTVVLEAMAAAKPVFATAHGGALEMIQDGRTGYHIPWDNAPAAAAKVGKLLNDRNQIESIGLNARRSVLENFSLPAYGKKIVKIFS
ncbi:Glycosyltransferase involved in cell wall bisynthesis [Cyclobacterium lianum]|uniref:Glycosyltransferase involved in cell wall bisynthesis n=1 Tax=Cyclobacterium lianum TaxID=388280 RepID=A0A1M7JVP8_9BACT|nr:glycosyltransferase family 4 protein [Cyclobacterium lianum]SHM56783.1 Glycosyltransferase involved in cell wall bisynthesis [Cyclobacterium lianum]